MRTNSIVVLPWKGGRPVQNPQLLETGGDEVLRAGVASWLGVDLMTSPGTDGASCHKLLFSITDEAPPEPLLDECGGPLSSGVTGQA